MRQREKSAYAELPLVYACSGCSSAAQLANTLAVRMDRQRLAEMSCIVGIGGDVKPLLRTAKAKRPILVLDGCPLHCARHCLERHDIIADAHLDLSCAGISKRQHEDPSPGEIEQTWNEVVLPALERLAMGAK